MAAVLVVGCGGDEQDGQPVRLSAAEVCRDGLLNTGAARGVELLTGASEFDPPRKGAVESVVAVAEHLSGGYAAIGASKGGTVCEAVPFDTTNRRRLSVSFEIQHESQRTGEGSEQGKGFYWEYELGRNALVLSDQAHLFFDCAGTRLAGPDTAVPVKVGVSLSSGSKGDEPSLREANLAIAHSAALAMSRELGCRDNGGLPAVLVVKQKAAKTTQ
ncbi:MULTISPECIES: hypothetical protein [unclassified Streptomyces]|uniref:hypothetical protein n=1 Tax=unclassified Streptomyces TaxID=2593676 RepID=UPI002E0D475A|nr:MULTISPECIES: hypothetical protein [unclassified Streptomyces]WSR26247.1 hypothetical protein OG573_08930 [Streptomyces sp. NBC_01205]